MPLNFDLSHDKEDCIQHRTERQNAILTSIGVTKTHALHVGSSEFLRADVDPASTPSGFVIDARNLRDWLDHFHISLTTSSASSSGGAVTIKYENQLSWMFAPQEVRIKSWEGGSKDLSTEMRLDPKEFVDYYVYDDRRVDLTLPMREFRVSECMTGSCWLPRLSITQSKSPVYRHKRKMRLVLNLGHARTSRTAIDPPGRSILRARSTSHAYQRTAGR